MIKVKQLEDLNITKKNRKKYKFTFEEEGGVKQDEVLMHNEESSRRT